MTPLGRGRRTVSFTVHQLGEYALGGVAVMQSGHLAGTPQTVIALIGAVMVAAAAVSSGRLGLVHWIPPVAHRVLDGGIVVVAGASPWLFGFGGDVAGVLLAETAALALLVLSGATRYRAVVTSRGTEPTATPRRGRDRTRVEDAGRVAGYFAGRAASRGPRAAGRAAGRVRTRRRDGRTPPG
ncbi:MAG: hypothetical protein JWO37_914 [Acidimicrobiales bacterium]|jgi:hypothetical protein|nr:hypothetical protein [Acidimicrobiales bacterium]